MNLLPEPTVAVDPGPGADPKSGTGIVAVDRDGQVICACTVRRRRSDQPHDGWEQTRSRFRRQGVRHTRVWWVEPLEDYCDRVCDAVYATIAHTAEACDGQPVVAIEGAVAPTGRIHGRRTSVAPTSVMDLQGVVQVVLREFRGIKVAPSGFGQAHTALGLSAEDVYPDVLCGRTRPTWLADHDDRGPNGHLLEAFEVAFAAHGVPVPTVHVARKDAGA